jgi:hypothetical protein
MKKEELIKQGMDEVILREVGDEKEYYFYVVGFGSSFRSQLVQGCGGGTASGNHVDRL